uniref:Uncharacterized protein n=1 Tax=Strongyloides venezuelensis TaxID=75913 RepID=A0A0K0G678_STRVS
MRCKDGVESRLGVLCQGKRDNPLETTMINIEGDIIEVLMCLIENSINIYKKVNVRTLDEHLANVFTPYPVFSLSSNLEELRFKLKNNHFDPSYLKSFVESCEMRLFLFEHFYKQYNLKLIKKLFISRHKVLEKDALRGNAVTLGNFPFSSRKGNQTEKKNLEYNF